MKLYKNGVYLVNGSELVEDGASAADEVFSRTGERVSKEEAAKQTIAYGILESHNTSAGMDKLQIKFDKLTSHDITFVGIIQTARASGLEKFPIPYVLTNCHNSLCATGGTINEDDHLFGLTAAKKYGGIYVPAHLAVLHQYMREMMAKSGSMIMGSDSHTRYGAFGALGVGEGGPELVKQLLGQSWDIPSPEVILVWVEGSLKPGVGPQDVALALIGEVFKNGFVKNRILEFIGPGIASLSMDTRAGIDVMTTETACLSSIWQTDDTVRKWLALHGRERDYAELKLEGAALYDGMIRLDLSEIEPMIALPFHPSNTYTIKEFLAHAEELLAAVESEAVKLFGDAGRKLDLRSKIRDGGVIADQGIVAGCAGGLFENITYSSAILGDWSKANPHFTFALYPSSMPVATALLNNGSTERLMTLGAIVRTAFCGPCFGAGDIPAHGALSIRHTTRNFPNREGSKPGDGQIAAVALMDARSIAATAANGGKICAATDLDWSAPYLDVNLKYHFNAKVYERKVYNGYGNPQPEAEIIMGPNISEWPELSPLPEHLILELASVIHDPVTTTDELIPSGETSSLRSNPQKLAEFTLSRKDPDYVPRAKAIRSLEEKRLKNPDDPEVIAFMQKVIAMCEKQPIAVQMTDNGKPMSRFIGLGSAIYAVKPGDGSAREQAASSQKILGGWANIATEYATKRYRSNLVNWGIIPFTVPAEMGKDLQAGDYLLIPHIRSYINDGNPIVLCALVHVNADPSKTWSEQIGLNLQGLDTEERNILMAGSLMNYNAQKEKSDN